MKRLVVLFLSSVLVLSVSACGCVTDNTLEPATEPVREHHITGITYIPSKTEITDTDSNSIDVDPEIIETLMDGYVTISDDHTRLEYKNGNGIYEAELVTEYDGKMWHESKVSWVTLPVTFDSHTLTATTLIFDMDRGLVRMNFGLDGEEGNCYQSPYIIFNEFTVE